MLSLKVIPSFAAAPAAVPYAPRFILMMPWPISMVVEVMHFGRGLTPGLWTPKEVDMSLEIIGWSKDKSREQILGLRWNGTGFAALPIEIFGWIYCWGISDLKIMEMCWCLWHVDVDASKKGRHSVRICDASPHLRQVGCRKTGDKSVVEFPVPKKEGWPSYDPQRVNWTRAVNHQTLPCKKSPITKAEEEEEVEERLGGRAHCRWLTQRSFKSEIVFLWCWNLLALRFGTDKIDPNDK